MSYLKFSPDLFLEKQELQRFKKFLDDDGFRAFLLANSLRFGLINKQFFTPASIFPQEEFLNGLVVQGAGLSISHNPITAINSDGNMIVREGMSNIATIPDNNWYWVKIKYKYSSIEKGKVSIDANGNLSGDADCRFLEVLRGQPNFPARIRFANSTGNFLEYDVLEVIDDQNAILENSSFTAETDLRYIVIGTFTPSAVPDAADKEIFQYDSCDFSLVQETSLNAPPTFIEGKEFFLARIKSNGTSLVIQDKRTQIWLTKANFFAANIRTTSIPWFGVEKIKYDDTKSTRAENIVYLGFAFRSSNYSVNSNLGIVTVNGGQGGKYKTVNDFADGDFNGCRMYFKDGTYAIIKNSFLSGGQINCYLDILDIDKFSNDGGTTFTGNEILITPDTEEIEINCVAQEDNSQSQQHIGETQLADARFVFPINTAIAKLKLLVYDNPNCLYEISYRFKHTDIYSQEFQMPSDTAFGHYTEKAFDSTGNFLPIVLSNNYAQNLAGGYIATYTTGLIVLNINSQAYSVKIDQLDLGDVSGVKTVELQNDIPQLVLTVGSSRKYQHFVGPDLTLSADMYIILDTLNSSLTSLVNGNSFFLHFKQKVILNNFNLRIVTDFVNAGSYTLLKQFTSFDEGFLDYSEEGLFITATVNDTNDWILNSVNEDKEEKWHVVGAVGEPAFQNAWTSVGNDVRFRKIGKQVFIDGIASGGGSGTTIFTLPVGYRPNASGAGNRRFPVNSNSLTDSQSIYLQNNGIVQGNYIGNGVLFLDPVRFFID